MKYTGLYLLSMKNYADRLDWINAVASMTV